MPGPTPERWSRAADRRAGCRRPERAVLPDWQTPPRADADGARWQERLEALAAYPDAGSDRPRHKAVITSEEHDLGVWLHTQRYKQRRGELDGRKADALDATVPGWRTGRQRRRRPRE
ncbi:helicase associated domain-containing protein [Arthrobacter sp. ISL-28]|uniref:helicase associated domain-containing protein n=1 Tax=Arthrobacter sp. ISL-28 TaxID=2819108 RepID=UPI001BEAD902|nr:helicase associated domain-containing protein [Arthrobacter sp. ISL-28]MBT2520042.1 helicase associated domain-containing protein [Arthrobacter sp. ISL-28]